VQKRRSSSTDSRDDAEVAGIASALASFLKGGPAAAWGQLLVKSGPAWLLLAWVIHWMTVGVGGEMQKDLRTMRLEHQELGFYLRAICVGVNKDQPNGWQQCQPNREGR